VYVFDRYAYDMFLDGRRLRIALPGWMIKTAMFFIPRPDRVICLGGDPEVLVERKKELSVDEVRRQVMALGKWATDNPNAVYISTTKPIDETVEEFLRALLLSPNVKNGS
jgi:hypothetical protein